MMVLLEQSADKLSNVPKPVLLLQLAIIVWHSLLMPLLQLPIACVFLQLLEQLFGQPFPMQVMPSRPFHVQAQL